MADLPDLFASCSATSHLASGIPAVRSAPGQGQRKPNRPELPIQGSPRVKEDQDRLAGVELRDGQRGLDPLAFNACHSACAPSSQLDDAVTRLSRNNRSLFRQTATGLALLLFLSLLPACAARHMPDWSRVQAVSPKTKTEVQLYKDEVPQGSRKIKGRFDSATDGSITLRLKDGQTRTLEKSDVRKVLTRRPFSKRWPGWVALGVTLTILAAMPLDSDDPRPLSSPQAHATITLPTAAAFFYGSRMKGIYEVPPKHRTRTQGAKQFGVQDKAPEKPKDHARRD